MKSPKIGDKRTRASESTTLEDYDDYHPNKRPIPPNNPHSNVYQGQDAYCIDPPSSLSLSDPRPESVHGDSRKGWLQVPWLPNPQRVEPAHHANFGEESDVLESQWGDFYLQKQALWLLNDCNGVFENPEPESITLQPLQHGVADESTSLPTTPSSALTYGSSSTITHCTTPAAARTATSSLGPGSVEADTPEICYGTVNTLSR